MNEGEFQRMVKMFDHTIRLRVIKGCMMHRRNEDGRLMKSKGNSGMMYPVRRNMKGNIKASNPAQEKSICSLIRQNAIKREGLLTMSESINNSQEITHSTRGR